MVKGTFKDLRISAALDPGMPARTLGLGFCQLRAVTSHLCSHCCHLKADTSPLSVCPNCVNVSSLSQRHSVSQALLPNQPRQKLPL